MPTQTRKTCTSLYLYVSWQCGWTSRWSLLNRSQSLLGDFHEALTLSPIHSSSRRNFRSILKRACRHSWKISMRLSHPWSENKVGSLLLASQSRTCLYEGIDASFCSRRTNKRLRRKRPHVRRTVPPTIFLSAQKERTGKGFSWCLGQRFSC